MQPGSAEVCLKILGGREVRSFVGSYLQFFLDCSKKHREGGRLGSNPDSEEVCLKIKGGREVRSFVGSSSIFGECVKKTQGGREVRFESGFRIVASQNQGR